MTRASEVSDGMDILATQYNAIRDDYARRVQVPATYSIFQQDGTIYADHCLGTGNDFSGIVASSVMQSVVDALPSGGAGSIFAKAADYTLTSTVTVNGLRGFTLHGEGRGLTGGTVTRFIAPTGDEAFILDGSGYGQALRVNMGNFEITGDKSADQKGLYLNTVHNSIFHDINLSTLDDGIHLEADSHYNTFQNFYMWNLDTGIYDKANSYINVYRDMWLTTLDSYGYNQPSTGTSNHVHFERFGVDTNCHAATGINIESGARNIRIDRGYFVDVGDTASGSAIYLKGLNGANPIKSASIRDCYCNRCGYGVRTDFVERITVEMCETLTSADSGATFSANTKRLTKLNNDFDSEADSSIDKLENSGTGTITDPATTAVITHGLATTPTIDGITVTLAENPTNALTALWVDTIGAANFTVNCEPAPGASNLDFGWRAVVP